MELWQLDSVYSNLPKLISMTNVTSTVPAILLQLDVVTAEEAEKLSVIRKNEGNTAAASFMYDILRTRRNGFDCLLELLEKTKQNEALNVLINCPETGTMLADYRNNQLHMKIMKFLSTPLLYGDNRVSNIRDILVDITVDDVAFVLNENSDPSEHLSVNGLDSESKHFFTTPIPREPYSYVTRSVSNRLQIDPRIFKVDCPDVFVFKGICRTQLSKLVQPFIVRSSSTQIDGITCRHIYLDSPEHWDDLTYYSKKSIHLIIEDEVTKAFMLERTTAKSALIGKYILNNSLNKQASLDSYNKESELIKKLIDNNAGVCICDAPGMGKTWLMESIARNLIRKHKGNILIYLKASVLQTPDDVTLHQLLKFACSSKIIARLIHLFVTKYKRTLYILLDGFDEVNPDDVESYLLNLKLLKNEAPKTKIVISSRPHMRSKLESMLGVIAYDILPFSQEEQVDTLVNLWQHENPNNNRNKLQEFAKHCVQSTRKLQSDSNVDLLGIPLKCYMLSTTYSSRAQRYADPSRNFAILPTIDSTIKTVSDLYSNYINQAISRVAKISKDKRDWEKCFYSYHIWKAFQLIFPSESFVTKLKPKVELKETDILLVALLTKDAQGRLSFVHRTFAEYLIAYFTISVFTSNINMQKQISKSYWLFARDELLKTLYNVNAKMHLIKQKPWLNVRYTGFVHSTVLYFVNALLSSVDIENLTRIQLQFTTKSAYQVILSCIHGNLVKVISLMRMFIKRSSKIRRKLFLAPLKYFDYYYPEPQFKISTCFGDPAPGEVHSELVSYSFLLHALAKVGTVEAAQEVFLIDQTICKNILLVFCQNMPLSIQSPIHVGIDTLNYDMVQFFVNKIPIKGRGLLNTILWNTKSLSESNLIVREMMLDLLINTEGAILDENINMSAFQTVHNNLFRLLSRKYNYRCKLEPSDKRFVFEKALESETDEHIQSLLVCLFGNANFSRLAEKQIYTVEEITHSIDVQEAKHALKGVSVLTACRGKVANIENYKILANLGGNWNNVGPYVGESCLHVVAEKGHTDLIDYFCSLGCNVNTRDVNGKLPAHWVALYTTPNKVIETLDCLVRNGVDLDMVDNNGNNVKDLIQSRRNKELLNDFMLYIQNGLNH